MKTPTIYDIKRDTVFHSPFYFKRATLKAFGQTMKSFSVYKENGEIFISAPIMYEGKKRGESLRRYIQGDKIGYGLLSPVR